MPQFSSSVPPSAGTAGAWQRGRRHERAVERGQGFVVQPVRLEPLSFEPHRQVVDSLISIL